jgi:hypothetical protein
VTAATAVPWKKFLLSMLVSLSRRVDRGSAGGALVKTLFLSGT